MGEREDLQDLGQVLELERAGDGGGGPGPAEVVLRVVPGDECILVSGESRTRTQGAAGAGREGGERGREVVGPVGRPPPRPFTLLRPFHPSHAHTPGGRALL